MRAILRRGVVAAGVAVLLGGVSAVAYKETATTKSVAVVDERDVPRLDGKFIRFSTSYAKRVQIAAAPCGEGALSPVVSVTGTATFDPRLLSTLLTLFVLPGALRISLRGAPARPEPE